MKHIPFGNKGDNPQASAWRSQEANVNPEDAESQERFNAQRQQRKIIASFLTMEDGKFRGDIINSTDVTLPEGAREEVLDRINEGMITGKTERDLLMAIKPAIDMRGPEAIMSTVQDPYEQASGAWLSGIGVENYPHLSGEQLMWIRYDCDTPIDFEDSIAPLLESIYDSYGEDECRRYADGAESLMRKMYGKQCEYWDQLQALNEEASERARAKAADAQRQAEMRRRAEAQRQLEAQRQAEMQRQAEAQRRAEMERSSEWLPGSVSYYQTSRGQAQKGWVSRDNIERGLFADGACEDAVMVRSDKFLFGVFDGAGGERNGRDASTFAAEALSRVSENFEINSAQGLADALRIVQHNMAERNVPGMTTATVTKILRRSDGIYAAYASLGDSRLYLVHSDGSADLVTRDEGFENKITNCLSSGRGYSGVKQFGEVRLARGDKIVLCSDGITGDRGTDLMSVEELAGIVSRSNSSEDASRNLVAGARKKDDRTALVIGDFS